MTVEKVAINNINMEEKNNTFELDAENKSIGRVASEAAILLMGKNSPEYKRNLAPSVTVTIANASKAKIHPKRLLDKKYKSFSGYPGGLKETPMAKMIEKKGHEELFRIAVRGMLPANKLRSIMLKNLKVSE